LPREVNSHAAGPPIAAIDLEEVAVMKRLIGTSVVAALLGGLAFAPLAVAQEGRCPPSMQMQCPLVPGGRVFVTIDHDKDGATIHIRARDTADVTQVQESADRVGHCLGGAPMPAAAPRSKTTSP
jgi:hypothetical protein